ncbi:hypothetical protein L2E82_43564 [Cichorium intybus]|uniref:Uncharacterized protein n=1 Tax=Cichorium intybus TaxID=13427 RepID=A0ACB8ZNV4_CICIN|nr:hypothetical protein L2E82_43564 [Cichorium intybus]
MFIFLLLHPRIWIRFQLYPIFEYSDGSKVEIDIAKLDLSRNSNEDLPLQLSSCASLETLILSRNKIKVWPSVILKSLQNLIPSDGFEAASKLQILYLSGNAGCLPEYPSFSSLMQLHELYLRHPQVQKTSQRSKVYLADAVMLDFSIHSSVVYTEVNRVELQKRYRYSTCKCLHI